MPNLVHRSIFSLALLLTFNLVCYNQLNIDSEPKKVLFRCFPKVKSHYLFQYHFVREGNVAGSGLQNYTKAEDKAMPSPRKE